MKLDSIDTQITKRALNYKPINKIYLGNIIAKDAFPLFFS